MFVGTVRCDVTLQTTLETSLRGDKLINCEVFIFEVVMLFIPMGGLKIIIHY